MTLPASGPLTFSDIQTEFGGTNPIALNEYYAGGGLVPAGTSGTYGAVPSSGQISVQNFYGTSAIIPVYIEEIFSTFVYTGISGSNVTINNGINLSGNGGLIWSKGRNGANPNSLTDTVRGVANALNSATTFGEVSSGISSFTSTGYVTNQAGSTNGSSSETYVSWTFREQPKFFDVVTYSGNGGANPQNISHNLGSTPGFIIVKRYTADGDNWICYHTSLGNTQGIILSGTGGAITSSLLWNNTSPTSSQFTVGTSAAVNGSGSFVAYLFAHNAGGFGATGSDNVVTCGSYTGSNSTATTVTLGYEPQWIMIKRATGSTSAYTGWAIFDNMRGMPVSGNDNTLLANTSDAENPVTANGAFVSPTATGFTLNVPGSNLTNTTDTFIYIAIRRGPMKVPTVATNVFLPITYSGNNSSTRQLTSGFPIDLIIGGDRSAPPSNVFDRLRGVSSASPVSYTASTADEQSSVYGILGMTYLQTGDGTVRYQNSAGTDYVDYFFRRAPSFFDEICYTGTGVSGLVLSHNLTVTPEFTLIKERTNDGISNWAANYNFTSTTYVRDILNRIDSVPAVDTYGSGGNNYAAAPTATTITVGAGLTNANASTYVAFLFATCAGVSKVGNYTGNGSTQTINCGFGAGGARFVLIKRTDDMGDWYVYDTARGMTVLTDPYLRFNSTGAEVATLGSVTTVSTGFALNSAILAAINVNGGTYIFLAIA